MSTFNIFYEQECHKESFRKVLVKPAHVDKKSFYLIPEKDIILENEKLLIFFKYEISLITITLPLHLFHHFSFEGIQNF